ncbi:MAG TPA: 50S ribosomal protein L25 [Planctomycetaceae bacterium]|nr:50S ribosomal protein L25 [Planctomycetaceae bacterium]
MGTEHKLAAQRRTKLGTRECRRLRRRGLVPGNVYGHEQEPVPIASDREDIETLVRSKAHVVDLELEGHAETAILREVQWDPFGSEILHFDLMRVDPTERVTLDVPVELRGVAPGVLAGGILEQPLHVLHVECPAVRIPDSIPVRIGKLEIGQSIHVSEIELPEDTVVHNPPDAVVVHIVSPKRAAAAAAAEEGEAAEAETEPEVVQRQEKQKTQSG